MLWVPRELGCIFPQQNEVHLNRSVSNIYLRKVKENMLLLYFTKAVIFLKPCFTNQFYCFSELERCLSHNIWILSSKVKPKSRSFVWATSPPERKDNTPSEALVALGDNAYLLPFPPKSVSILFISI